MATLVQYIDIMFGGGPGSGWFTHAGHIKHTIKTTQNILRKGGWEARLGFATHDIFEHPGKPGHQIHAKPSGSWQHFVDGKLSDAGSTTVSLKQHLQTGAVGPLEIPVVPPIVPTVVPKPVVVATPVEQPTSAPVTPIEAAVPFKNTNISASTKNIVAKGIMILAEAGASPKLLRLTQNISSISKVHLDPNTLGEYNRYNRTIELTNATGQGSLAGTFIHEVGHHIDFSTGQDGYGLNNLTVEGKEARMKAFQEYTDERDRVEKLLGKKVDTQPLYSNVEKVGSVLTHGPSSYALKNRKEWFAENFKHIMKSDVTKAKIAKRCPATFDFIDGLRSGKYLI